MSYFSRLKNSHVFVTPVKKSFEFLILVTNTCEFFTRVTVSFECESETNLSQVWKKKKIERICHPCEEFLQICHTCEDVTNTEVKESYEFFTSVIRSYDICDKFIKKSIYNAFIFTAAYLPRHNGSGTIRTKTSSSWDDSTGTVRTKFRTGLFTQHYQDGSLKI